MVAANDPSTHDDTSPPPKPQTADEFRAAFNDFLASDNFNIELEPGASERIWSNVGATIADMPELTKEEIDEHVRKFEESDFSGMKPDPESLERIRKAVKKRLSKLRKHQ